MRGILIYVSIIRFLDFLAGNGLEPEIGLFLDLILHRIFYLLGYSCKRDPYYMVTRGTLAPAHFEFPLGALLLGLPVGGLGRSAVIGARPYGGTLAYIYIYIYLYPTLYIVGSLHCWIPI